MKSLTLKMIAAAVHGELHCNGDIPEAEATAVVIDSRKCIPGAVFVATRGERVDGHSFIGQVFEGGALGAIVEELPKGELPGPCILVEDSFTALKELAKFYRMQLDIKIVGIVGSVGKTSTKELVASVLSQTFSVLKTEGNFNNEVGVPLTILSIRDEHEMAVVEMGISDFGEMDRLASIVKPDAVVMTNIGPCHLEKLNDLDGVLRAKTEVLPYIGTSATADEGLLVLNSEDEKLSTIREAFGCNIVRYGRGGDVAASGEQGLGLMGSDFDVLYRSYSGESEETESGCSGDCSGCGSAGSCSYKYVMLGSAHVPLPGRHQIMNALAAAAVGMNCGLTPEQILAGIGAVKPVSGRSNLIKTDRYLIIDDCYNANPKSMRAAIDMLKDASGRRCAILGDMFELGTDEAALHAETGTYAVEHELDVLVCVGALSKHMYEAAQKAAGACDRPGDGPAVIYAEDLDSASALIADEEKTPFREGDNILIKASHGMHFTELVEKLKAL